MKLLLIGFMGAGKSSVAKELESLSGTPVHELDEEIVSRSEYSSIPEIFEKEGEEYFRKCETDVLAEVMLENSGIVSSGGGVVESEQNRKIISDAAVPVVYLQTDFEAIEKRVGDPSTRPLFADRSEALRRYEQRLGHYEQLADWIIPTEGHTPKEIAEIVRGILGEQSFWSIQIVIGDPIAHSLSPKMHNAAYGSAGVESNTFFCAHRVRSGELKSFVDRYKSSPALRGLAVTIPHKEEIIPHLDVLSEEAKEIGAVNTVTKDGDGKLIGDNTDWKGIYDPILSRSEPEGKRCCIIGAGGTARAAAFAMKKAGAELTIVNRTVERAERIAQDFPAEVLSLGEVEDLKSFDIVIHTTSVGLLDGETTLFGEGAFSEHSLVMDVVYKPKMTPFLKAASAAGATIITGDEMFLAQGITQFSRHTGTAEAPTAAMKKVIEAAL